jgi:hypothetical protein
MLTDADIIRSCQAIRACCSLLSDRLGNPVPMSQDDRKAIVLRMDSYCARLDNSNHSMWGPQELDWMTESDSIAETVRYYREQADNYMAEVAE